jgi:ribosomal protein S27E
MPAIRCEKCGKRSYRFLSDQTPVVCPTCGAPLRGGRDNGRDGTAVEAEVRRRLYGDRPLSGSRTRDR